jgi:dienelactone hydrolase
LHVEDIEYSYEGVRLVGQLAVDESRAGRRPAVLIAHEGGGLDDHAKGSARRLAELGYVAFALDYYGDGVPLPPEQMMPRFSALDGDRQMVAAIGRAGLEVLLASEYADPAKVAAIGYCFGGTVALELARKGADLRAVVGFHSSLTAPEPAKANEVKAKILVCIGADDPIVPAEQRAGFEREMTQAGADWRLNLYGGAAHSFTNPSADGSMMPGIIYNESADQRSWRAMLDLFAEVF